MLYRETNLSAEEAALLNLIDRDFAEAVDAGKRIMAATDKLNSRLNEFEDRLKGTSKNSRFERMIG